MTATNSRTLATAPRGLTAGLVVSLIGFRSKYKFVDCTQYVDDSTCDLQAQLIPAQVLLILKDGHQRFRSGQRVTRDLARHVSATAGKQHPLAVALSCIDSRATTELIFDLGVGDILSIRIAGSVISRDVLGSMQYACAVSGAKMTLVMRHAQCGAVTAAVKFACSPETAAQFTGCQRSDPIVQVIQQAIDPVARQRLEQLLPSEKEAFVDAVARRNVSRVTEMVLMQRQTLDRLHQEGRVAIIGAIYDVATGILSSCRTRMRASECLFPVLQHQAGRRRFQ